MKNYAIILASGSSNRFGDKLPKQFAKINGKTILELSVEAFEQNKNITDIIVICNPDFLDLSKNYIIKNVYKLSLKPVGQGMSSFDNISDNSSSLVWRIV